MNYSIIRFSIAPLLILCKTIWEKNYPSLCIKNLIVHRQNYSMMRFSTALLTTYCLRLFDVKLNVSKPIWICYTIPKKLSWKWSLTWCFQKVCFLRCFLSRSFENRGKITKLLNQFDDWWFRKSKEIWVSILQNTTSAKWIMIMEIFWTP